MNNNYNVLWLNQKLRLQDGDSKSAFLEELKRKVEQELPSISIQACVTGKDFIWLAKNGLAGEGKWDAFIIDAYGNMSEEGDSNEIVMRIIEKCEDVVKKSNIVLFCLTENGINSKAVIKVLEQTGFNRNNQNNKFFYNIDFQNVEKSMLVFFDLVKVLDEHGKLFKNYPKIKQIYDAIDSAKGKKAILDLLKWKESGASDIDFESGIREIVEDAEDKLQSMHFFDNAGEYAGKFYKYIDAAKYIDKTKQVWKDGDNNKRRDYLNLYCRTKWESSAMSFFGLFANVAKHDNIFQKPKLNEGERSRLYYKCYREMVFLSFEIFANWYVEFIDKYEANGKNMKLFFNDMDVVARENSNDMNKEQKHVEAKRLEKNNNGLVKGVITRSRNDDYWGVKSEEGKFYRLDYNEKSDWKGDEKVMFALDGHYAKHVELMETN